MKILVIMGIPRKGNTYKVTKKIAIMPPLYPIAQSFENKANISINKSDKKFYEAIYKDKVVMLGGNWNYEKSITNS